MQSVIKLAYTTLSLLLALTVGTWLEKRHYRSIEERERALLRLPALTMKKAALPENVKRTQLVSGNIVIGIDYFRQSLGGLLTLFGGRLTSFESALDRARREAVLRMKEQAPDATAIINVRFETCSLNESAKRGGNYIAVEVYAFGTALWT